MYLEVKDIKKSYGADGSYIQVLKGISTGVEKGEMCVIQGTSGSGKSTLLNCIGGLDVVDSGSIQVDGQEMVGLKMDALSDYEFYEKGLVSQPVCAVNHIQPFLEKRPEKLWGYYCTGQYVDVTNRFIVQPGYRTRILGTQMYNISLIVYFTGDIT